MKNFYLSTGKGRPAILTHGPPLHDIGQGHYCYTSVRDRITGDNYPTKAYPLRSSIMPSFGRVQAVTQQQGNFNSAPVVHPVNQD